MSRILVTGASGFVGRAVVAALAKDGHAVRAAVRRPAPAFPANVEIVQIGDLAEPIDWSPLLAGIDVAIHLAGIAHIGPRVGATLYDRVNHLATAQLATAAAQAGVSRLVFMSSIRAQSGPGRRSRPDGTRSACADRRVRPLEARRRTSHPKRRPVFYRSASGSDLRTWRERKSRHAGKRCGHATAAAG